MQAPHRIALAAVIALGFACAPPALADAKAPATRPALKTIKIEIPRSLGVQIEMIQLPGGKISINGKDGKPVEHVIKPVWIGKFEVRWVEYDPFWTRRDLSDDERAKNVDAANRPSRPYMLPHRNWDVDQPALGVHLRSAKNYCAWLSKLTGKKFRLPTEQEWEYACRAGGTEPQPADDKALKEVAWFLANTEEGAANAVGARRPNAWGLHDMLGNVAEWVIVDRQTGEAVVAGGSVLDPARDIHPSIRHAYTPDWQRDDSQDPRSSWWLCNGFHIGFRLAMDD